ncbi:hypothetical protein GQ457_13G011510 [Hibiscus cannabinus]
MVDNVAMMNCDLVIFAALCNNGASWNNGNSNDNNNDNGNGHEIGKRMKMEITMGIVIDMVIVMAKAMMLPFSGKPPEGGIGDKWSHPIEDIEEPDRVVKVVNSATLATVRSSKKVITKFGP